MSTTKKLGALLGAGMLSVAMFGTAVAGVTVWAEVTGHQAHSAGDNNVLAWGDEGECVKVEAGEGGLGLEDDTYVLTADYGLVIVKSGSGEFANTLFADASEGETVWADTDGDGVYTEKDGQVGDQNISHIIFCDEQETETTTTTTVDFTTTEGGITTTTTTVDFTSDQSGLTTTITQPNTDTIGGNASGNQAPAPWLLLAALGILLGSLIVVAPSRAKTRQ